MISDICEKGRQCWFTFNSSKCDIANKLRQTMLSGIPTLAIDTVEIEVNTSRCDDELLAHRLGLIPFCISNIDLTQGFQVELNITATEARRIYSKDLEGKIKPVHDKIIICNLYPGESIKLKAHFKIGTGSIHAKWNPICNISYIKASADTFRFEFQTTGVLTNREILNQALFIINQS